MHEVKAMAAKLRARAEAVKTEISATAEECVKRIVSRKQEILARVTELLNYNGSIKSYSQVVFSRF